MGFPAPCESSLLCLMLNAKLAKQAATQTNQIKLCPITSLAPPLPPTKKRLPAGSSPNGSCQDESKEFGKCCVCGREDAERGGETCRTVRGTPSVRPSICPSVRPSVRLPGITTFFRLVVGGRPSIRNTTLEPRHSHTGPHR